MAVTLQQIAKKAGVSIAAVSKALNNRTDIAEATAKKVRRIAEQLGYTANVAARALVTRRAGVVGVIAAFPENPTVVERLRGIQAAAAARDYLTSISFHDGSLAQEIKQIRLTHGRVDGLIVTPSNQSPDLAAVLGATGYPVVLMSEPLAGLDVDFVGNDEAEGGRQAAAHILSLGLSRVAYLGGSPTVPSDKAIVRGLTETLAGSGKKLDKAMVQWGTTTDEGTVVAVDALMALSPRPDAIVAFSDLTALWALARLHQRGVRVPRDVAVLGYDNIEFSRLTRPTLTSISQPNMEIGRAALNALMDRLQAAEQVVPPRKVVFRPELVARESTARAE